MTKDEKIKALMDWIGKIPVMPVEYPFEDKRLCGIKLLPGEKGFLGWISVEDMDKLREIND